MENQKKSTQQQYLEELSRNLQRAGFDVAGVENEGKPLISREGVYLCRVSGVERSAPLLLFPEENMKNEFQRRVSPLFAPMPPVSEQERPVCLISGWMLLQISGLMFLHGYCANCFAVV